MAALHLRPRRIVWCAIWAILGLLFHSAASAAPPPPSLAYKGFYVLVDPYAAGNSDGLIMLKNAAAQICNGTAPATSSNFYQFCADPKGNPFLSGIMLTVHWCNWEIDSSATSCGDLTNVNGTSQPNPDATSVCGAGYQFDTCAITTPISACPLGTLPSTSQSLLGQALYYLCQINQQRASNTSSTGVAAPLAPLTLSLALEAGIFVPSAYYADGSLDVPVAMMAGGATVERCGREPQIWQSAYLAAYSTAFDGLVTFIGDAEAYSGGSLITVGKLGGINENTAEIVSTGTALPTAQQWTAPATNGNPDCTYENFSKAGPGTSSAQQLLNIYNAQIPPGTGPDLAASIETAFGTLTGSMFQTLYQAAASGLVATRFMLSVDTRNSEAWPEIACGIPANTAPCVTDSPGETSDQWSALFLFNAVKDLTTSTGSGASARTSSDFANYFTVSDLLIDATNLVEIPATLTLPGPGIDAPPVTSQTNYSINTNCTLGAPSCPAIATRELPCNLNNKLSANTATFREGWNASANPPAPYLVSPKGIASLIGFQTDPTQTTIQSCDGSNGQSTYGSTILQPGLNDGAQIIEISLGEATDGYCQPDLATELAKIPVATAQCDYTPPAN